jgi:hypothetical protein
MFVVGDVDGGPGFIPITMIIMMKQNVRKEAAKKSRRVSLKQLKKTIVRLERHRKSSSASHAHPQRITVKRVQEEGCASGHGPRDMRCFSSPSPSPFVLPPTLSLPPSLLLDPFSFAAKFPCLSHPNLLQRRLADCTHTFKLVDVKPRKTTAPCNTHHPQPLARSGTRRYLERI